MFQWSIYAYAKPIIYKSFIHQQHPKPEIFFAEAFERRKHVVNLSFPSLYAENVAVKSTIGLERFIFRRGAKV